ncbi:serine hydrolase domain-containing protein [Microbulbifer magnicolonia]|uniref:serine hydrolase domain-containing protein n=1 Tax=Microbulbifer magnicolonia TaxID=3109744 RepID=UPI002B40CFDD|nr:serine hydrolase domain-containing protein [Microbulbifer sp. GG15]
MKLMTCALFSLAVLAAGCGRQESAATAPKKLPVASAAQAHSLVLDTRHIDQVLSDFTASGELVGVSALIYQDGREVYFGAHGMADRERKIPMARDTLVRIYSMTKPVTGAVLMTLYEQGKFQLDDPLEKYAAEFAGMRVYAGREHGEPVYEAAARPITVSDIMRHTAGFYSDSSDSPVGELYRAADPMSLTHTLEQMAESLGELPLVFQPGSRWLYGPSTDVQAFLAERLAGQPFLAERLAGQPFAQLLQERILDPLQMHDTGYRIGDRRDRLARMYNRHEDGSFTPITDDRAPANAPLLRDWPMTPGGWGLVSSLDDYMRFARMLLNGGALDGVRVLKPETVALMAADMLPDTVTDRSWLPGKGQVGFGINFAVRLAPPADRKEASGAVGEFFWDGFANTLFWVDPQHKLAAVLFTQYQPWGGVDLHKDFRDAVYRNAAAASALGRPAGPDSAGR